MRRDLDLKRIRYFMTVHRLRSFSKASKELNIAQPALSRHIQALERDLNVELLVRTSQGVEPTEAGKKLLELGERILAEAAQIRNAVVSAAKGETEPIWFGLPPSLSLVVIPRVMDRFKVNYPKTPLNIVEGHSLYLGTCLEIGKIDVAIITPFDDPPKSQFVAREELVLVSSKPRGVATLELKQLASVPLLTSIGLKSMIERFAKPCRAKFHYMVELNSMVILKDMVMRGVGEAILPYAVVRNEIDSGRLHMTRIVNPTITRDLVVAIRPEVSNRAPAVAFKNEVEFVLAELEREIGPKMPSVAG